MMTNEQYLLGKLAEEAAELAQIAIKAQQFGLDHVFGGQGENPKSNQQRIEEEYNDVLGVVAMLNDECEADIRDSKPLQLRKMAKVSYWREQAADKGFTEKV